MTGEVVNLRRARKARTRVEGAVRAAANRAKFGRSDHDRRKAAAELARVEYALDGAKLERPLASADGETIRGGPHGNGR